MKRHKHKRTPAQPVKVAPPPPPVALSPAFRQSVQGLLMRCEQGIAALRQAGHFEILGLLVQAAHALKRVTEHSHDLEQALGLLPPPPAPAAAHTKPERAKLPAPPPKPSSNGVPS